MATLGAGRGACCCISGSPGDSLIRGGKQLFTRCSWVGFSRTRPEVRVFAGKSSDSDSDTPLVEMREDGRLFMDEFHFDDDDDDSQEEDEDHQEPTKAQTLQKPTRSSLKLRKKAESEEPLKLRRGRDMGVDEETRYTSARSESEPMQLRRRREIEPPWKRSSRRTEGESEKETSPTLPRKSPSRETKSRKREEELQLKKDLRRSSDEQQEQKTPEQRNIEKAGRVKLQSSSEFRPVFLGRPRDDEDDDAQKLSKRHPFRGAQIYLPYHMRKRPHIAILGGGMAGLCCALALEERGIQSTVFDTGKHGLGGRMGTREIIHQDGKKLVFDHAAQYFTVKDPKFQRLVDEWVSEGAVKEWDGVVGMLREGEFSELQQTTKYVAAHGMRHLADHMVSKARLINIERPCWINTMVPVDGSWNLREYKNDHGQYDAVVIAHNGKCANRLLAEVGAPLIARQMKRLDLSSVWALLAAFDEPLSQPLSMPADRILDGAFVEGVNSLSWMGNNTRKLALGDSHPHCWTFFSTAAYGKKHKVPQESIPKVKSDRVIREVLLGVEMALGIPEGSLPSPFYTRVQLWGAALPTNAPGVPCIFDPHSRVGICGDWLLGASLEAAALSGIALAHHMADFCERAKDGLFEDADDAELYSVGLQTPLAELDGHDIGQFPGSTTPAKQKFLGRALKWGALVTP